MFSIRLKAYFYWNLKDNGSWGAYKFWQRYLAEYLMHVEIGDLIIVVKIGVCPKTAEHPDDHRCKFSTVEVFCLFSYAFLHWRCNRFKVFFSVYLFQIMDSYVLPASANWYCSRIVDCSVNGTVCIGAKNAIDVWNICADPVKHVGRIDAHSERIVAVSLCHAAGSVPQRCCSAGQDGKVRVWNLENRELMHEHSSNKVCYCVFFYAQQHVMLSASLLRQRRPSVCLSVWLSQCCIVSKQRNVGSWNFHWATARALVFFVTNFCAAWWGDTPWTRASDKGTPP